MVLNQILVNQVSFVVRNGCEFRLRASKGEKKNRSGVKTYFLLSVHESEFLTHNQKINWNVRRIY